MTCFMDPRFKVRHISSEKVSDIKTKVMSEMHSSSTEGYNAYLTQRLVIKSFTYSTMEVLGAKVRIMP